MSRGSSKLVLVAAVNKQVQYFPLYRMLKQVHQKELSLNTVTRRIRFSDG